MSQEQTPQPLSAWTDEALTAKLQDLEQVIQGLKEMDPATLETEDQKEYRALLTEAHLKSARFKLEVLKRKLKTQRKDRH
jgi:hypothetical protein